MFLLQISTNTFLFLFNLIGIVLNRRNVIITIMCIELVLLNLNLNFIIFSIYLDDFYGQIFSLIILTVAASESAIGLLLFLLFFFFYTF